MTPEEKRRSIEGWVVNRGAWLHLSVSPDTQGDGTDYLLKQCLAGFKDGEKVIVEVKKA